MWKIIPDFPARFIFSRPARKFHTAARFMYLLRHFLLSSAGSYPTAHMQTGFNSELSVQICSQPKLEQGFSATAVDEKNRIVPEKKSEKIGHPKNWYDYQKQFEQHDGYHMSHVLRKPYANNKGADQPEHQGSLISAFVIHCLDSIISLVSISEI